MLARRPGEVHGQGNSVHRQDARQARRGGGRRAQEAGRHARGEHETRTQAVGRAAHQHPRADRDGG